MTQASTLGQDRHPSVAQVVEWLKPNPNLPSLQMAVAADCAELAVRMLELIEDDPELTAGLRKLLEAKDCFVRASLRAPAA